MSAGRLFITRVANSIELPFALLATACSVGDGSGSVHADKLNVPSCWTESYDLYPTFFAAIPQKDTLTIRIANGHDLVEFSDVLELLVDDVAAARQKLGTPMKVGLPVGVTTPGIPLVANTDPPLVHMTLALNHTCHSGNISLYSIAGTITFAHLFNGDRNESSADNKLIEGRFDDVLFADPRQRPPGETDPSKIENVSHLGGDFRFYFQRGQPAQPFP